MRKLILTIFLTLAIWSEAFAFGTAGNDSYLVSLLHFEGANASTSFPDDSIKKKVWSATGSAQVITSQYIIGNGSLFVNGGNVTTPTSTDFDFGTGDFTYDFWVKFITHNANMWMVQRRGSGSQDGCSVKYRVSTGSLDFYIVNNTVVSYTWAPTDGVWYHIEANRRGTECRLFVDGTQVSTTGTNSSDITLSNKVTVGTWDDGSEALNGYIDEVRITKGLARHTANFTRPTTPYCSGCEMVGQIHD